MLRVLRMHRDASYQIDNDSRRAGRAARRRPGGVGDAPSTTATSSACATARPAVLAPTGTIGLMMDCDTTGIEPDLGLVKIKKLVGGGTMSIVNQTIPRALRRLGYDDQPGRRDHRLHRRQQVDPRRAAPGCRARAGVRLLDGRQHDPLRGPRADDGRRPAVPVGRDLEDGQHAGGGDRRGRRGAASAVVGARPQGGGDLPRQLQGRPAAVDGEEGRRVRGRSPPAPRPRWSRRSSRRSSTSRSARSCRAPVRRKTFEFRVADCKGFVTVGEYDDGQPGEIFITVSKQGSTLAGIMDAFAKSISYGLQYGVPLRAYVEAFVNMRFEPAGMTDDPDVRFAGSIMDYLFRRLALEYLSYDERAELGIFTIAERTQPTLPGVEEAVIETSQGSEIEPDPKSVPSAAELAAGMRAGALAPTVEDNTPARGVTRVAATRRCACSAASTWCAPAAATPARAAATPAAAADATPLESAQADRRLVDDDLAVAFAARRCVRSGRSALGRRRLGGRLRRSTVRPLRPIGAWSTTTWRSPSPSTWWCAWLSCAAPWRLLRAERAVHRDFRSRACGVVRRWPGAPP